MKEIIPVVSLSKGFMSKVETKIGSWMQDKGASLVSSAGKSSEGIGSRGGKVYTDQRGVKKYGEKPSASPMPVKKVSKHTERRSSKELAGISDSIKTDAMLRSGGDASHTPWKEGDEGVAARADKLDKEASFGHGGHNQRNVKKGDKLFLNGVPVQYAGKEGSDIDTDSNYTTITHNGETKLARWDRLRKQHHSEIHKAAQMDHYADTGKYTPGDSQVHDDDKGSVAARFEDLHKKAGFGEGGMDKNTVKKGDSVFYHGKKMKLHSHDANIGGNRADVTEDGNTFYSVKWDHLRGVHPDKIHEHARAFHERAKRKKTPSDASHQKKHGYRFKNGQAGLMEMS